MSFFGKDGDLMNTGEIRTAVLDVISAVQDIILEANPWDTSFEHFEHMVKKLNDLDDEKRKLYSVLVENGVSDSVANEMSEIIGKLDKEP